MLPPPEPPYSNDSALVRSDDERFRSDLPTLENLRSTLWFEGNCVLLLDSFSFEKIFIFNFPEPSRIEKSIRETIEMHISIDPGHRHAERLESAGKARPEPPFGMPKARTVSAG